MHASDFNRERRRIERQSRGKLSHEKRALKQLVARTRAIAIIEGHRIIGYRMPDASVACVKIRYRDESAAVLDLVRIAGMPHHAHKPVRSYRCPWCFGYHLTSRA